jgi:hypothetical protein
MSPVGLLHRSTGFWTQSTAALRVAQRLRPVPLSIAGSSLQLIPPLLRDPLYRVVADNRYSILGKVAEDEPPACQLRYDYATVQERFLETTLDGMQGLSADSVGGKKQ